MQTTQLELSFPLADFLSNYQQYGFKTQTEMVEAALLRLQQDLETEILRQSAALYAEVYEADTDLQALTDDAVLEWPECPF